MYVAFAVPCAFDVMINTCILHHFAICCLRFASMVWLCQAVPSFFVKGTAMARRESGEAHSGRNVGKWGRSIGYMLMAVADGLCLITRL